jgi:hypothetical protein
VGWARPVDAELAQALARARSIKPIVVQPDRPVTTEWRDDSVDAWGARRKGLARQWASGQCLQGAVASLLGCDVSKVPNPEVSYNAKADWHDHYNERLAKATGYRLEFLEPHCCPPRNPNQLWIAGIHEPGDEDGHAVVARGAYCFHDPAGIYQGGLPMHRVTAGFLVRPTRRAVPVFSPHRGSVAVIPA